MKKVCVRWNFFARDPYRLEISKTFVKHHNQESFLSDYEILIHWLDQDSIDTIDKALPRYDIVSENNIIHYDDVFGQEDYNLINNSKTYSKNHQNLHPTWYRILNEKWCTEYIEWKLILDCGAYDWEETQLFDILIPRHWWIVSYEPTEINYSRMLARLDAYKSNGTIIPVNYWVWDKNENLKLIWGEWETVRVAGINESPKEWETSNIVKIVTIDSHLEDTWLLDQQVWLIKRDIEWFEQQSIMWAKETIMRDKPILIVSIYHHAEQFFGIKPLLESWNLGYKFEIYHSEPHNIFAWVVLLAYL